MDLAWSRVGLVPWGHEGASRGDQGTQCATSFALFNLTLAILLFIDTDGDG